MSKYPKVCIAPRNWRAHFAKLRWNKLIYDQINGIENGEETTSLQRPLKLGKRKSFRKRLRSFRVRVSRIRVRVKISPSLWLKRFADAYVQMMVGVQDQLGSGGGLVMGFHSMYAAKSPYRVAQ
ncbi:hypothetical protein Mapa_012265 [Marchantia paleacea]|nr:hypothetical protein Mapa_012265 [Marchantia paleacea]